MVGCGQAFFPLLFFNGRGGKILLGTRKESSPLLAQRLAQLSLSPFRQLLDTGMASPSVASEPMPKDWTELPDNLPEPQQDRAAFHLLGHPLPALIDLPSTASSEETVDLFNASLAGPILLFVYPKTGVPGKPNPPGWDAIPGARGCTPHLASVAQYLPTLRARQSNVTVYGLSTQSRDYQREVKQRLKLPFDLLSDADRQFTKALDVPTFTVEGESYLKRMTLLLQDGQITRVDYPIPRPDQAAHRALDLLRTDGELMQEVEARDAAAATAKSPT